MMRNSGVTYTHIIIDNDKYIKLEGIWTTIDSNVDAE
jgi:hypothetical protein